MTDMDAGSRFRKFFTTRHVVLPVVHVETRDQAILNTQAALEHGSDGVFLINHSIDWQTLLAIHAEVAREFPASWIGVNCLDLWPSEVFNRLPPRIQGVWVDNAMIEEDRDEQRQAAEVLEARRNAGFRGLYFGGVAFKCQRHVDDLRSAATKAAAYMDVVTTSGPGTGQAADIDKIRVMKETLGAAPLAIASGITPDNIGRYLPYSDCYLVATGISKSFSELDPREVRRLIDRVRGYEGK